MWQDDRWVNLNELWKEIDNIDNTILELLKKRMEVSEKIGNIKSQQRLPIYVPEREEQVIITRQQWGEKYSLASKFVRVLFKIIMFESKMVQNRILVRV